jgi:hypothetical protein
LQAQNSHIPSHLTHTHTHTHKTQIIATSKIHRFQQPSQTQIYKLKKIQQIPTTLTNTDPNCNFKNSDIPSSKNTTHIITNLNFTDSKLKKHHPHHCKPQLHRFQAQKHTHTHTHLLLQAQISQISRFFKKKKPHNFAAISKMVEWVVGFLLDNAKYTWKISK